MSRRLLFVCVHNAGRSVMAEAFVNHLDAEGRTEAISAGTIPQGRPHPEVVEAMREIGIDVSAHEGRELTDELVAWADRVITLGCAVDDAACPAIRFSQVDDWGLDDPKGRTAEQVREIRDQIRGRVEALLSAP